MKFFLEHLLAVPVGFPSYLLGFVLNYIRTTFILGFADGDLRK